jgi:hypothetical protein
MVNNNVINPLQGLLNLFLPPIRTTTTTTTTTTTPRPRLGLLDLFFPNVTTPRVNLPSPGSRFYENYNIFGNMFNPNNTQNLINGLFFGRVNNPNNHSLFSIGNNNNVEDSPRLLDTLVQNFDSVNRIPPRNIFDVLFPHITRNNFSSIINPVNAEIPRMPEMSPVGSG